MFMMLRSDKEYEDKRLVKQHEGLHLCSLLFLTDEIEWTKSELMKKTLFGNLSFPVKNGNYDLFSRRFARSNASSIINKFFRPFNGNAYL